MKCLAFLVLCLFFNMCVAQNGPMFCGICEAGVSLAENYIKQNNLNETVIENDLAELCTLLPSQYQSECNLFVEFVAPNIIKELEAGTAPEKVCENLGICNGTKGSFTDLPQRLNSKCGSCRIATWITRKLHEDNAQKEVALSVADLTSISTQRFYSLCSKFGAQCDETLELLPAIVEKIANGEHKVCKSLARCTENDPYHGFHHKRGTN